MFFSYVLLFFFVVPAALVSTDVYGRDKMYNVGRIRRVHTRRPAEESGLLMVLASVTQGLAPPAAFVSTVVVVVVVIRVRSRFPVHSCASYLSAIRARYPQDPLEVV